MVAPVHFAESTLTVADHILVEVITDDGIVGLAEAIPRPMIYGETRESVTAAIKGLITPELLGQRIDEMGRVVQRLANIKANHVAKGSVELAIFDALGKLLGISGSSLFRVGKSVNP